VLFTAPPISREVDVATVALFADSIKHLFDVSRLCQWWGVERVRTFDRTDVRRVEMAMTTVTRVRERSRSRLHDGGGRVGVPSDIQWRDEGWPDEGWRDGGLVTPLRRSAPPRGPAVCANAHAPDLHGSRLTPRGRLVVAAIWLVMAVVAGLMVAMIPGGDEEPAVTTIVMVEPGETLWSLAGHFQSGADRHETIATIMAMNGLESASEIRPGDTLIVPVEP
jgi:hypothetical protein